MLYYEGDSRHTQNIQINKVIGENENCVFYFMEKTKQTFRPTQYYKHSMQTLKMDFKLTWLHLPINMKSLMIQKLSVPKDMV